MPIPTFSEVIEWQIIFPVFSTSVKGWGFCHKTCKTNSIFANDLKMVKLTILSDDFCKEIGTAEADNLGGQLVVNPNKELCGAFVNEINLTLVNYTEQNRADRERRYRKRWNYLFSKFNYCFKGFTFQNWFLKKKRKLVRSLEYFGNFFSLFLLLV